MRTDSTALLEIVKPMLAQVGEEPTGISFLAEGATCEVWRLISGNRSYALRLFLEEDRILDGRIDAFIRRGVIERGGAVVAPLLNSETLDQKLQGKRWSLEPYVEGHHPQRGGLPQTVCAKLGETLAALHDIPADRYGRPSEVSSQMVVGSKAKSIEGVAQRFENPIPETWANQYTHPLLAVAPDLFANILIRLREVSEHVRQGRPAVCHTDLHEKQLICAGNNLAALIDFGEAAVLDRHWDLGSVLYFHGDANFSKVFEAYISNGIGSQTRFETVASFSVAIAMHHASRSRLQGKSHRLAKAIEHIRSTI